MTRLGSLIERSLTVIGVVVVLVLIGATTLGAVGRYLHMGGLTWSFELTAILFLWTTAIGTVLSEIAGENVSIDGNTHDSGRGPIFRIYHALILLAVGAALIWSGDALLARTAFNPTPVLRWPNWVQHSIIPFMGGSLAIIAIWRILTIVRGFRR